MKKLIVLLLGLGLVSSCETDDSTNQELVGEWELIEILADPGDGSGTFAEVQSSKTIRFHEDGTITSNGTLCTMSLESNNSTSGTYSLTSSHFSSADCNDPEYTYQFEHTGNILIITYPCIEPCQAKYRRK